MVKSKSEYKSIQKKLVAAVAMVLVASIMVVTSSYAWFTLSTAPEVTGINTSVGSNGNLEIALRTGALADIGNSEGATFPAANNSWGNLVDLSNEMYHLEDITLMPAALTAAMQSDAQYTFQQNANNKYVNVNGEVIELSGDDAHTKAYAELSDEDQALLMAQGVQTSYIAPVYNFSDSSWIKVPTYGADGRISDWNINSYINPYQNGGFPTTVTEAYGVRGIGTTSGLSQAELNMLNARKAVSGAKGTALNGATSSLNTDAVKIANIAVKNQLGQAIDMTDVTNIRNTITNLQTITVSLDEAVRASVVALGVSQGVTVNPDAVFNASGKIPTTGEDGDLGLIWKLEATSNLDAGAEGYVAAEDAFDYTAYKTMLEDAYAKIVDMNSKLSAASTALESYEAGTTSPTYTGLVGVLSQVINPNEIVLGDKTVADHDMNSLVSVFTSGTTPQVTIKSGIYHDIALFVGNYSTPASLYVNGAFAGVTLNQNFTVQIETQATAPASGWYLDAAYAWLSGLKVDSDGEEVAMMTDLYAYAIDLAFRTNAAGSNLLLQTEAKNRVEGSDTTQGAGSYMEFTAGHVSFTIGQMANLMKNIRVIFIDTDATGTPILAVAGLDVGSDKVAIMDGTGADAKQKYWHVTVNDVDDITVDKSQTMTETEFHAAFDNASVTVPADVTAYLAWEQATDMNGNLLYMDKLGNLTTSAQGNEAVYDIPNYTVVDAEEKTIRASLQLYGFTIQGDGEVVIDEEPLEKQTITALTQNQAKGITAMVYLDGNNVSNADVAIGGTSMKGKLNLQFASDAALDPMDYTFGEKLATPTAEINGSTLTITAADDKAENFKISVGGYSQVIEIGDSRVAVYDLADLPADVPAGTYKIEIVAAAQGYVDSNRVEVEYTKTVTETP